MQKLSHVEELFIDGHLIDEAVSFATRQAVWEAKQLGFPIAVNRDGQAVLVPPEEIQMEKPIANFPIPPKGRKS